MYPGTYPEDKEPFAIISIAYLAEGNDRSLQANDDVTDSRWFSREELPKNIAFDSNQLIIEDFLKIWK